MKEKLENRLKEIEEAQRQAFANYNAIEGAKQECLRLLDLLSKEEKEELPPS